MYIYVYNYVYIYVYPSRLSFFFIYLNVYILGRRNTCYYTIYVNKLCAYVFECLCMMYTVMYFCIYCMLKDVHVLIDLTKCSS